MSFTAVMSSLNITSWYLRYKLEVVSDIEFFIFETNVSTSIFRFHKLLKNVIVNEESQIHCLKIVNEFWSTNPQVCNFSKLKQHII